MSDQPVMPASETPPPDITPDTKGATATFTQEDVNRLMAKTRQEAREATTNNLLKELGFEKADDLRALVTAAKERQDAELSIAEKAQKDAEKAAKERDELRQQLENERHERRIKDRDGSVKAAAKDAGANNPLTVLGLARELGKLDGLLSDDGTVNDKAVAALIDDLKKADPTLFAQKGGPGSPSVVLGKTPMGKPPTVRTSGSL